MFLVETVLEGIKEREERKDDAKTNQDDDNMMMAMQ